MLQHKYSDCSHCGGQVKAAKVKIDWLINDKLYLFENVPAGVCQQCGEKYFTAKVAKKMDASIHKNGWTKFIKVPLISFPQMTTA